MPEDKVLFVKNNTAAQHKHHKSLSSDHKAQVYTKDAAEHKKHRKFLSPEQKGEVMTINAAAHKIKMSCFPRRKKLDSWKPRLNKQKRRRNFPHR